MKKKLLLYCTKAKPYITQGNDGSVYPSCVISDGIQEWHLNGKIVAECDFEVEEIRLTKSLYLDEDYITNTLREKEILKYSCLSYCELADYLGGKDGYAIHIKNLHIFDKSKELSDYYKFDGIYNDINNWKTIDKAPQNMMYAYDLISELGFSGTYNMQLIKKVLISIQPQWMCKILNGDKTIEVRKVVLKEMI
jgi:predicted transcriptional regulator